MKISVELEKDVALVLFELLADFHMQESLAVPDKAARLALIRLSGALESTLVEPLSSNYDDRLAAARASLSVQFGKFE